MEFNGPPIKQTFLHEHITVNASLNGAINTPPLLDVDSP